VRAIVEGERRAGCAELIGDGCAQVATETIHTRAGGAIGMRAARTDGVVRSLTGAALVLTGGAARAGETRETVAMEAVETHTLGGGRLRGGGVAVAAAGRGRGGNIGAQCIDVAATVRNGTRIDRGAEEAVAGVARQARAHGLRDTHQVGATRMRITTAVVGGALVDIGADLTRARIAAVARTARCSARVIRARSVRVATTIVGGTRIDATADEPAARVARETHALRLCAHEIRARGVRIATTVVGRTFVDVCARGSRARVARVAGTRWSKAHVVCARGMRIATTVVGGTLVDVGTGRSREAHRAGLAGTTRRVGRAASHRARCARGAGARIARVARTVRRGTHVVCAHGMQIAATVAGRTLIHISAGGAREARRAGLAGATRRV